MQSTLTNTSESQNRPRNTEATKFDVEKPQWNLLPGEIEQVVELLTIGAQKYSPENWRQGFKWSRVFNALLRHLWKFWWHRESYDDETGKHHLAAVALMALWLIHYDQNLIGDDDRR